MVLSMKPYILVVEDDPAFSALLTTVLEMQGYAVTCADSTLGTLEQARRVRPCAIVLDLGLPSRSGTALLSELRADPETADIPVIIVSALPEALTPERRALADAVLAKPIDPRVLLDLLRSTRGRQDRHASRRRQ